MMQPVDTERQTPGAAVAMLDHRATQERLVEALAEYHGAFDAGRTPSRSAFLARYPEIAQELAGYLDGFDFVHQVAPQLRGEREQSSCGSAISARATLGDFRIVCELGRGGMGVVYEAEQLSLGRRVALKVLPFAAMLDKQQLNRFKTEARAAGTLDHPNIVAIYSVGVERGVHYYAMQLIEGESLAQVIARLGKERTAQTPPTPDAPPAPSPRWGGTERGEEAGKSDALAATELHPSPNPTTDHGQRTTDTQPVAALTTLHAPSSSLLAPTIREYFRTIARLGVQAAEALDHAHQNGILHRDVKPGNLMVDDAGKVWITDFGLARIEQDAAMTMTGDLLGTLRYMSPEQALAKRVVVDHRSDVYSLGATLYELLTLQPVYSADDRQELLRQIAFDEPKPPRQRDARIPRDLETIVLKAIEKNPADRYTTAQELADDLRRSLDDQPIKAKRQSLLVNARKWSRRHRPVVWASATTLLLSALVVAGNVGWAVRDKQSRQAVVEAKVMLALDDIKQAYDQDNLSNAVAALRHAEDLLATGNARADVQDEVKRWQADLQMVQRLERIRLDEATRMRIELISVNEREQVYSPSDCVRDYLEAFREYSTPLESDDVAESAAGIRRSAIKDDLIAALDALAIHAPRNMQSWVLSIARAADDNAWRNRLREAIRNDDLRILRALAEDKDCLNQPPSAIIRLAQWLLKLDVGVYPASDLLRRAQRVYPNDFWINCLLGRYLRPTDSFTLGNSWRRQIHAGEVAGDYRTALARRPDDAATRCELGEVLQKMGQYAEAEAELREAIRRDPGFLDSYVALANVLEQQGKHAAAEELARDAIRRLPESATAYRILGQSLASQNELESAITAYRDAIRRHSDHPMSQTGFAMCQHELSWVLRRAGKYTEADQLVQQLLRARPDVFGNAEVVGGFYAERGNFYVAAEQHKIAFEENPKNHSAAVRAACLLLAINDRDGYQALCRKMLEQFGETTNPAAARRTALACLISPQPVGDVNELLRLVQLAVNDSDELYLAYRERALAAYRTGDFEGAKQWGEEGRLARWSFDSEAQNQLIEAMALHQLGQPVKAKATYDEALGSMRRGYPNAPAAFGIGLDWNEWLYFELLRREAAALIEPDPTTTSD